MTGNSTAAVRLYTIGHSTRSLDELVQALRGAGVRTLVDIRTVPRSRHVPQFNQEALRRTLPRRRVRYRHIKALGGLRKARADSANTAWRNASFRGFADYMQTEEFAAALRELRALAREAGPVAVMCAEAVPWRCHRSLVADALLARRDTVFHIMGPGKVRAHTLTPWARVEGTRVTYPGPPAGAKQDSAAGARSSGLAPHAVRRSRPPSRAAGHGPADHAAGRQGTLWSP